MSRRYSRGHILFYFYFCKECSENICLERELNYLISHTTKLLWVIMFESGIPYYKVGGKQICMEMIYFFNSINLCFRRVSEKKTDKTSSGPDFSVTVKDESFSAATGYACIMLRLIYGLQMMKYTHRCSKHAMMRIRTEFNCWSERL